MNADEHRFSKMRVAAIGVLLLMTGQASAQPCGGYEITAIVTMDECPPFGNPPVIPRGINEQGWMVGYFNACVIGPNTAFLWTPDDGLVVIPMPAGTIRSRAVAISGSRVVGTYTGEFSELGFLYDYATNEFTSLGTLRGGNTSEVGGINGKGEIVGSWGDFIVGPFPLAFIWREGEMIDINPDFGTASSRGLAINSDGFVTGWMGDSQFNDARAFIWDNGKVSQLPPLPGGITSEGMAINQFRDVAGRGWFFDRELNAEVWRAFAFIDGKAINLGILPGFEKSIATGINDDRIIVGASWTTGSEAFIWKDGEMGSLNDVTPPEFGRDFYIARGINQAGQIAAGASGPDGIVAVLLTPIEAPIGDLDGDCTVGAPDLLILLSDWGPCKGCPSDLDGNGMVGASDLLILLANWG